MAELPQGVIAASSLAPAPGCACPQTPQKTPSLVQVRQRTGKLIYYFQPRFILGRAAPRNETPTLHVARLSNSRPRARNSPGGNLVGGAETLPGALPPCGQTRAAAAICSTRLERPLFLLFW